MVNEDKIKIMTELASYEVNDGKRDLEVVKRLKSDYISYKSFLTCFFASIALLIIFAADFSVKFINQMTSFTTIDFTGEGVQYLTIWIFFMVIYTLVSGRIYRKEYEDADKKVKVYKEKLKMLEKFSKMK